MNEIIIVATCGLLRTGTEQLVTLERIDRDKTQVDNRFAFYALAISYLHPPDSKCITFSKDSLNSFQRSFMLFASFVVTLVAIVDGRLLRARGGNKTRRELCEASLKTIGKIVNRQYYSHSSLVFPLQCLSFCIYVNST